MSKKVADELSAFASLLAVLVGCGGDGRCGRWPTLWWRGRDLRRVWLRFPARAVRALARRLMGSSTRLMLPGLGGRGAPESCSGTWRRSPHDVRSYRNGGNDEERSEDRIWCHAGAGGSDSRAKAASDDRELACEPADVGGRAGGGSAEHRARLGARGRRGRGSVSIARR